VLDKNLERGKKNEIYMEEKISEKEMKLDEYEVK
jgi:hypothetical protein